MPSILSPLLLAALIQNGVVPWQPRVTRPPDILKKVGFDQKLNAPLPLGLPFRDEHGRAVRLGDYFGKKPVVLTLVYYECPMLCTLALNGELRAFRGLGLTAGRDFEAVTVSINPLETPALAAAKRMSYLGKYGRAGADWHFLTGEESAIRALADAVGFHYAYDPASKQYAHTTGLMVATPDGRLAAYQYGVEYASGDLRLALVDASGGKIGNPVDQFLLYCFHYDPAEGKYTATVMNLTRAAALAMLLGLGVFIAVSSRRDRRRKLTRREVHT